MKVKSVASAKLNQLVKNRKKIRSHGSKLVVDERISVSPGYLDVVLELGAHKLDVEGHGVTLKKRLQHFQ